MTDATLSFPDIVPSLGDGAVRLRAHRTEDAERIVEQGQDAESSRWTTVPHPYQLSDAHEYLTSIAADWGTPEGARAWVITAADDPEATFLGTIDLRPKGAGIAELGFGLHPQGRGRHLVAAATRLVARWWFDHGGVRVYWRANRGNFASWRVAWACGFEWHGCQPGSLAHRGEAVDGWIASVGRDDPLDAPRTRWNEAALLRGEGIILRPWQDDDATACEEPDTPGHFMPPGAAPTTETFAEWLLRRRERMALGKATHWCIADSATDHALGEIVLIETGQEEGSVELGYQLFPSARGRGVATKAAALALGHAFTGRADGGRGFRRAGALTVGDNESSARVLERLGFVEWGREPAFCARDDGSLDDARHWVLIPSGG